MTEETKPSVVRPDPGMMMEFLEADVQRNGLSDDGAAAVVAWGKNVIEKLQHEEPHTFGGQNHPPHPGGECGAYEAIGAGLYSHESDAHPPEIRPHGHSQAHLERGDLTPAAYLERHLVRWHGFSPSEASGNVADLTRAHQADHDGLHVFAGRSHPAHPGLNCHEYETMPSTWDTPPPVITEFPRQIHISELTQVEHSDSVLSAQPYEAGTVIVLSEAQAATLAAGGTGSLRSLAAAAPPDLSLAPSSTLVPELIDLLTRHGIPAGSDTPAYILAEFLVRALTTFEVGINRREEWHTTIRIDGTDTPSTDPATIGVQMWKDTPDG